MIRLDYQPYPVFRGPRVSRVPEELPAPKVVLRIPAVWVQQAVPVLQVPQEPSVARVILELWGQAALPVLPELWAQAPLRVRPELSALATLPGRLELWARQ